MKPRPQNRRSALQPATGSPLPATRNPPPPSADSCRGGASNELVYMARLSKVRFA